MPDDSEIAGLAENIASALHASWRERFGVVFESGKEQRAMHGERSQDLGAQLRLMGLDVQRRGGIVAMHAVVKAVNRIDSRCKKALEDLWIDIPGYKRWSFLP